MTNRTPYNKGNLILELTFNFALEVLTHSEKLESDKKFVLARQLLKSGTSIGANVREAQNAESKKDFIHKLKIAAKEVDETEYWLQLCEKHESYPSTKEMIDQLESISKVLTKIIASTRKNITASSN